MSDRSVPVPADLLQELVDAAERAIWGGGVYDGPTADVVTRTRPLLSVPAEPQTPAEVLMPPETLEQRLAADGRLWKLAFEEARKSATIDTPAGSVAPDEDGEKQ